MKDLVHQKEFNDFLLQVQNDYAHDFFSTTINNSHVSVTNKRVDYISKQGDCIVICYHPLGEVDGISVMNDAEKVRMGSSSMPNNILISPTNIRRWIISNNEHRRSPIYNIQLVNQT